MQLKSKYLEKFANELVKKDDMFTQLKKLGNKKNYPYKLQRLQEKISTEVELFERKNHTQKLVDLQKDLKFVLSQISSQDIDKTRVDELAIKYSIN